MGQIDKALEIDREILSLFKADGEYSWEEGFNITEISSLSAKHLQLVVSTMITSSKRWADSGQSYLEKSAQICRDALSVFDLAPSKTSLRDRSFVFAGYSTLAQKASVGRIKAPDGQGQEEFENDIASSFLNETDFQQYHHCRALCVKADIMARYGNYEGAASVVDEMKAIYDPQIHSKAIAREYSAEHCAKSVALSALWHHYLNPQLGSNRALQGEHSSRATAMETVDYVVERILPEIGRDQFVDFTWILIPIILVSKEHGPVEVKRALTIYKEYVADPILITKKKAHWVMAPTVRPLLILLNSANALKSCSSVSGDMYDGIDDDISWILDGEEKFSDWHDNTYTIYGFNLSLHALLADCCLCLAKLAQGCDSDEMTKKRGALIKEGLRQSGLAEKKMKDDDGNVTATKKRAYMHQSKICSQLQNLLVPV